MVMITGRRQALARHEDPRPWFSHFAMMHALRPLCSHAPEEHLNSTPPNPNRKGPLSPTRSALGDIGCLEASHELDALTAGRVSVLA